jgi:hypothetical protein
VNFSAHKPFPAFWNRAGECETAEYSTRSPLVAADETLECGRKRIRDFGIRGWDDEEVVRRLTQ